MCCLTNWKGALSSAALDAPTNLQIVSQTEQSITVQWTNSKANVSSYLLKYSPISGDGHGEELFPRQPGYSTKATLTGAWKTDRIPKHIIALFIFSNMRGRAEAWN